MSSPPKGAGHNYNLSNLAFPRVILNCLELTMLSSEVRTWGELRNYIKANSGNLQPGAYERVQELEIQYAEAGPAVPIVPPVPRADITQAAATSRTRGRGLQRVRGRAGRRGYMVTPGGVLPRSTTPQKPTPVAQQSEGLSQVALPDRRVPPAPLVYENARSVLEAPESSRASQESAPSQQLSHVSGSSRFSPPRRGSVVLRVVPGSNPNAEPTVLRSYTKAHNVDPSAVVQKAPTAQNVPFIVIGNVENSKEHHEAKTKANVESTADSITSSTIIDSEIPTSVSNALSLFPALRPNLAD